MYTLENTYIWVDRLLGLSNDIRVNFTMKKIQFACTNLTQFYQREYFYDEINHFSIKTLSVQFSVFAIQENDA